MLANLPLSEGLEGEGGTWRTHDGGGVVPVPQAQGESREANIDNRSQAPEMEPMETTLACSVELR